MQILVIDNGTSYLDSLQKLLTNYVIKAVSYNQIPDDYNNYNLIILSGGHSVSIIPENEHLLSNEIRLIQDTTQPVIGICYGSELINYALGGTIHKIPQIKGSVEIKRLKEDPIFSGIYSSNWQVFGNHHFAIDKLAPGLIPLASSASGIEIYKHQNRPIIGLQFHPEMFTDKTIGDEILMNSIKIHLSNDSQKTQNCTL